MITTYPIKVAIKAAADSGKTLVVFVCGPNCTYCKKLKSAWSAGPEIWLKNAIVAVVDQREAGYMKYVTGTVNAFPVVTVFQVSPDGKLTALFKGLPASTFRFSFRPDKVVNGITVTYDADCLGKYVTSVGGKA